MSVTDAFTLKIPNHKMSEHVYSYCTQGDGVMEAQLTGSSTQFGIKV